MEALPGQQLLVKTCCLQGDVEQGRVAEGYWPPRDEKGVCGCVEIEGVVLESNLVEN